MLEEKFLRKQVENSRSLANLGSSLSMYDKIEIMAVEQERINQIQRTVVTVITGFAGFLTVGLFFTILVYLFVMTQGKEVVATT